MATLMIGYSSSYCQECAIADKPSDAALNEAGHYTVLGYMHNGEAGCQQKWDRVVYTYTVDMPREDAIDYFKKQWPHLAGVPDEDWTVVSTWGLAERT